ncbi:MAG: hypothetical protein ACREE5_00325 [Acetobacteraceae bacterium]
MSGAGDADTLRLCRHMHTDGVRLCLRYTLSDGSYVGEIDMVAKGEAAVWQTLAYDLLSVTSAAAERRAVPEPGEEAAAVHTA